MAKEKAIFGGGCFWGIQYYFDQVPGVTETVVGYIGGHTENPTYEQVSSHITGHAEAVEITFDPKVTTYKMLLKHFFRVHDPTQMNRQGPDIGDNYRSAIFYKSDSHKKEALDMIKTLTDEKRFKAPIVTQITKATKFYPAEEYHQKFTERTGQGMCHVDYAPIS